MVDGYLVPEKTVVTAKGSGAPLDVSGLGNRVLLLTLLITDIVEQESLDVSVWGSAVPTFPIWPFRRGICTYRRFNGEKVSTLCARKHIFFAFTADVKTM